MTDHEPATRLDRVVLDQVTRDLIGMAWPALEPHFARACARVPTDWTPAKIRAAATRDELTLWAVYDVTDPLPHLGALATGMKTVGGERTLVYAALGGREMARWLDLIVSEIETLAKSQGATRAEIEGRLGWSREMRGRGYRPVRIVLQKVLA